MAKRTLNEQEMVDILEDIARNGNNGAARIAAIKVLREMDAGTATSADGFAALDQLAPSNVTPLRTKRANPMPEDPPPGFGVSEKGG